MQPQSTIANINVHPDKISYVCLPMGAILDNLLETLDAHSLMPNLCCLSIEYLNAGFDNVFHHYSVGPEVPLWLVEGLQEKQEW
ncbi:hypothetical protein B0H17DRAFT_1200785 [Mycena rosella]|uniref:Uncharacterized protein n=1 Tax=Mycena rosella TaxID=1033263 RepID=A0AAD7GKA6_MYCRO|nr:hypothetical protein B0H17DRAFT_1200785 [Mycena rosella]